MIDPRVQLAFDRLIDGGLVRVTTRSRTFEGKVFQIFRSAYEDHITVGVAETKMGLVHFFRATKPDCRIDAP